MQSDGDNRDIPWWRPRALTLKRKQEMKAHKECEPNGTWFTHPETHKVWSNYTTCINLVDLSWQQQLNVLYETGYTISLVALLVSLGILTYFRTLRCARITLHMNLFASFAVNNALWLIWYGSVIGNAELLIKNGYMCRLLHVILNYFLLTNYAWMLCEGFYLHTLLVSAFTSEHRLVKWLMGLGWSIPAVIVTVYGTLRASSDDPTDQLQCWINEGNYMNVLVYPVTVSTLLNLLFLCNIVRVLLTKLRAGPAIGTQPSRSILQAFRATLLLVPLLGLHYLVIPFRPGKGHPWERAYGIVSAITASFQGLCVAILFCFCNGEVIAQFKRKWEGTAFARNRANSCTATTVSVRCPGRRRYDYQSAPSAEPKGDTKHHQPHHHHHQPTYHHHQQNHDRFIDNGDIMVADAGVGAGEPVTTTGDEHRLTIVSFSNEPVLLLNSNCSNGPNHNNNNNNPCRLLRRNDSNGNNNNNNNNNNNHDFTCTNNSKQSQC
ncbi:calcitonin gene-related peptide type 1 receptor-like [Copidosoma floridanum]|uniref:calcitonin gene-related peptide type 1 receptor-like n=1 Tax=Copidosoma floridanum TaxID=29053 RepID=UPI000C6F6D5E|nr:calcitonin gene-related peptide type 1 receptor-like [Copidosoma floridanum]